MKKQEMSLELTQKEKDKVLERFMKEFFPYGPLQKAGFFTKEMRGDYKAQAARVCQWFGFKTVYEYRADELRCHLTYADNAHPANEGFVTVLPSIYE